MHSEVIELIAKAAKTAHEQMWEDISPYYGYSGRAMYGRRCFGITCERPVSLMGQIISTILEFNLHESADRYQLEEMISDITEVFMSARTDSLGLQTIVYFPDAPDVEEPDTGENEE